MHIEAVAERVRYQMVVYFPPHLTIASALPGEMWTPELRHFCPKTIKIGAFL